MNSVATKKKKRDHSTLWGSTQHFLFRFRLFLPQRFSIFFVRWGENYIKLKITFGPNNNNKKDQQKIDFWLTCEIQQANSLRAFFFDIFSGVRWILGSVFFSFYYYYFFMGVSNLMIKWNLAKKYLNKHLWRKYWYIWWINRIKNTLFNFDRLPRIDPNF